MDIGIFLSIVVVGLGSVGLLVWWVKGKKWGIGS